MKGGEEGISSKAQDWNSLSLFKNKLSKTQAVLWSEYQGLSQK